MYKNRYIKLLKQQLKDLLEQLLHVYNELKDENEIAIINEYGCNAKRFTTAVTGKIILSHLQIIYILLLTRTVNISFRKIRKFISTFQ